MKNLKKQYRKERSKQMRQCGAAKLQCHWQNVSNIRDLPAQEWFVKWIEAAARAINHKRSGEITVRLVDEEEGRELNATYRQKDYATNVLSFPYVCDEQTLSGDLVLCPGVVAREAQEQDKTLTAHYAHLVVHGVLHLQGFDHLTEEDAEAMESVEKRILASLGFADPYADDEPVAGNVQS